MPKCPCGHNLQEVFKIVECSKKRIFSWENRDFDDSRLPKIHGQSLLQRNLVRTTPHIFIDVLFVGNSRITGDTCRIWCDVRHVAHKYVSRRKKPKTADKANEVQRQKIQIDQRSHWRNENTKIFGLGIFVREANYENQESRNCSFGCCDILERGSQVYRFLHSIFRNYSLLPSLF